MTREPTRSTDPANEHLKRGIMWRAFWVSVGLFSLTLGAIGVVLPLLPTTPFVLLAAFAFTRSSPRLRVWLTGHSVFGPIITDWETYGAIAPRYKIMACSAMGAGLLASALIGLSWQLIAVQALCMILAAIYVLSRPSGKRT